MISFVTVITEILKWSVTIFLVFFIGIAGGVLLHLFVYFIENFSNIIQKHRSKRKNKNF